MRGKHTPSFRAQLRVFNYLVEIGNHLTNHKFVDPILAAGLAATVWDGTVDTASSFRYLMSFVEF